MATRTWKQQIMRLYFQDLEEATETVPHESINYRQLDAGPINIQLTVGGSSELSVMRASIDTRVDGYGHVDAGMVHFELCLGGRHLFSGKDLSPGDLYMAGSNGGGHQLLRPGFETWSVNCSANLIRAHLGEVADFPVEGLVVRPETELFSTVCSLSCGVLHNSLVGGDDRDFLDQLAMALSRCLPAQTIDRRDSLAARIVQAGKVREMLTEENDMTLGDICREIGYSSRAVRRTFLEVYGVSPSQYRLAVRLSRVREELKQNPEATGAISFSASRQGFSHMGRFSGQYRRQFGETPSETLRRYRSRSVCF